MQNKKIFTTDLPTTKVEEIIIKPTKEFTTLVIKELNNVSISKLAPFILLIANDFKLEISGTKTQFIWKGDALDVATRILENSINYN